MKVHGEAMRGAITAEFETWRRALARCYNRHHPQYKDYGGRGIKMCEAWRCSYGEFLDYLLKTIGRKPSSDYSLDRISNDGDYEPGNIRWATKKEQRRNTRQMLRTVTIGNKTQCLTDWSAELSIPYYTFKARVNKGYSEQKLTMPVGAIK